jgi:hypothetical protein
VSAVIDILEELLRRGVAAQADGETIRLKPRSLVAIWRATRSGNQGGV